MQQICSEASLSAEDIAQQPELLTQLLAHLQDNNYEQHHPTRFYYIQALLKRAENKSAALQLDLHSKALNAINELQQLQPVTTDTAQAETKPSALSDLAKTLSAKNLQLQQTSSTSFEDTLRLQEKDLFDQQISENPQSAMDIYKETVAELNTEKFMEQVFNETPKGEPGPLNAHMLVIKTLSAMQQISPSYLRRIVTQIDTMFYLNSVEPSKKK